jgi:hypothetical protein
LDRMIIIAGDDIYLSIRHKLTRNVIAKTHSIPYLGLRFAALGTLASEFRFHGADEASRLPRRIYPIFVQTVLLIWS